MSDLNELFYRDTYAREFTADVVSCTEGKNGFEVVLSDTAFIRKGAVSPPITANSATQSLRT